jgi:hypothetical protein
MPTSLTAALAAAVLAALWLRGRRRPPLIRDADTSVVAALNRAQIALVQAGVGDTTATLAGPAGGGRQGTAGLWQPGIPVENQRAGTANDAGAARAPCHP